MKDKISFYSLLLLAVIAVLGVLVSHTQQKVVAQGATEVSVDQEEVIPEKGYKLNVKWDDLGKQMVEAGVIDAQKFESIYAERGGLTAYQKNLLSGEKNAGLIVDMENAPVLLNLLWALGLANDNPVLNKGPMVEGNETAHFASTGGWSLAQGEAMDHYSKHHFIILTPEQQALVEDVAKNIYRPCCNNATSFPDCNHGMAMLGYLELAASQGASEKELYEGALILNTYWFPNNYLNIAKFFKTYDINWQDVDAKTVLGMNYSSGSGYRQVLNTINPQTLKGGVSCGV